MHLQPAPAQSPWIVLPSLLQRHARLRKAPPIQPCLRCAAWTLDAAKIGSCCRLPPTPQRQDTGQRVPPARTMERA